MSMMNSVVTWLRLNFRWSNSRQSWEERVGALLVVASGIAVWWNRARLSLAQELFWWGLILLVGAILLRRGWLKLFGPVLFYDMVRAARRSRYVWMRCGYAGLMLFILLITFLNTRSFRFNERLQEARLAENFFESFMLVQLVVVMLLTPAYVAGAISDEKERKTLEFLLATDLRNREIVLSKVLSRLANLTLFVLTGLPILGILQFMGGVDPNLVLAGFAATGLTMLGLAGVSILSSTVFKRARDAIAMTYLITIAYVTLATFLWVGQLEGWPIMREAIWFGASAPTVGDAVKVFNGGNLLYVIIEIFRNVNLPRMMGGGGSLDQVLPPLLEGYAWFHGVLALLCITWAVVRLRAIALSQMYGKVQKTTRRQSLLYLLLGVWFSLLAAMFLVLGVLAAAEADSALWIGVAFFLGVVFLCTGIWFLMSARWRRPTVGNLPMLWKEVFVEGGLRFNWLATLIVAILVILSFVWPAFILWEYLVEHPNRGIMRFISLSQHMNIWVRFVGTIVACLTLLGVAVRASTAISGERDRQTFDGLLTSPMDSNTILWSKWLGSIMSIRLGWFWLIMVWGLAVVTGGMHVFALPLVLAAWFVFAAFVSMLGMWFSMVSRSSMRATVWTILTIVGVSVGHLVPWLCCGPILFMGAGGGRGVEYLFKFQLGFTPPVVLGFMQFSGEEFGQEFSSKEMIEFFAFSLFGVFAWAVATLVLWIAVVSPKFRSLTGRHDREPEGRRLFHREWQEDDSLAPVRVVPDDAPVGGAERAILLEETWERPDPGGTQPPPDDWPRRVQRPP